MVALSRLVLVPRKEVLRSRGKRRDSSSCRAPKRDVLLRRGLLKAVPFLEIKDDSP